MERSWWNKFILGLDDDERLIYPEMYKKARDLYADIRGIVYIVRSRSHPEHGIFWVTSGTLDRLLKKDKGIDDVEILSRMLMVNLRLPWNKKVFEWSMDEHTLNEMRDDVEIAEVILKVRRKSDGVIIKIVDKLDFESNREDYEVLEKRYIVTWKPTPTSSKNFLGIDPDSVRRWMCQ